MYENGAFSKSVATVTLKESLSVAINKKATVTGQGPSGEITGKVYDDYPVGTEIIQIVPV